MNSTARQIALLTSLTAKLMLAGLATCFARVKHARTWKPLFCESTTKTGPQYTPRTVQPFATTGMSDDVDCGTPEEGDRIQLGLCDRCNGQTRAGALWVHYGLMLPLELCGHHDRHHRDALTEQGWERARLNMDAYRQGAPA